MDVNEKQGTRALKGNGGNGVIQSIAAQPAVAAAEPGVTAFRGSTSREPAPLLNFVVRYHVGRVRSEVLQVSIR